MYMIKNKSSIYFVNEDEILYFRQTGRNIEIRTFDKIFMQKNIKIADIKNLLGDNFCQCHSYLIINTNHLLEIQKTDIIMAGGLMIGLGYNANRKLIKIMEEKIGMQYR